MDTRKNNRGHEKESSWTRKRIIMDTRKNNHGHEKE